MKRTYLGIDFLDVNLISADNAVLFLFGWRFPLDSDGRRVDGDDGDLLRIAGNYR